MKINVKNSIALKWMNAFDKISFDRQRKESEAAHERLTHRNEAVVAAKTAKKVTKAPKRSVDINGDE